MRSRQTRSSKGSISRPTTAATLGVVIWLLLLSLPGHEARGQGTVRFSNDIAGGPGVGITLHIWGPSATNPMLSLVGLGSNDSPSGTTPFGSALGMALIGAGGSGGHYGYATTFAQLLGAPGSNQPVSALVPIGQTTIFRSGSYLGTLGPITVTLTNNPGGGVAIPADAPCATFRIVAWDNSSGLYPTWAQAYLGWVNGLIGAGMGPPFVVEAIGGVSNPTPNLNNDRGSANGMMSFNLYSGLAGFNPPRAWTFPATNVTTNSAVLRGQVDPNGFSTTAWFRWGTATDYDHTTAMADAGSCHCNYFLTTLLTGLTPETTYSFRTAAANIYGGAVFPGPYDGDQTFTTLALPTVVTINTGSGYWDAASSSISYTAEAGGSHSFILLQSADPTAPLTSWTRVATNSTIASNFPIAPVGAAAPKYYRIKSE